MAFDLAAIKTTARLVKMRGKPAFVIFTAGSPTAPRMYDEAAQLVQDYGLDDCPHHIADRAAFRHAAAEGKTAMEDRKSVVEGKSVSGRVDHGGRRIIKKKTKTRRKI